MFVFSYLSCAKNFDKSNILEVSPPPTAKIEGKHAIFISKENFNQINRIKSENCESWALKLNFEEPIKKSIENLVYKMFKDFEIVDQKLEKEKIEGMVLFLKFLSMILKETQNLKQSGILGCTKFH